MTGALCIRKCARSADRRCTNRSTDDRTERSGPSSGIAASHNNLVGHLRPGELPLPQRHRGHREGTPIGADRGRRSFNNNRSSTDSDNGPPVVADRGRGSLKKTIEPSLVLVTASLEPLDRDAVLCVLCASVVNGSCRCRCHCRHPGQRSIALTAVLTNLSPLRDESRVTELGRRRSGAFASTRQDNDLAGTAKVRRICVEWSQASGHSNAPRFQ